MIVDVARSLSYREGHIPGAIWGIRSRLSRLRSHLHGARHVTVTSPDGSLARLAWAEVAALTSAEVEVRILEGGTDAWHAFGRPLVRDKMTPPDSACTDVWLQPFDRALGVEAAIQTAIAWEASVSAFATADGTVKFGVDADPA